MRAHCRIRDAAMRLLMSVITVVLASLGQAHAQQNSGSANDVLPLCKTWLKVAVEGAVAPEDVALAVAVEVSRSDYRPGGRYVAETTGLQDLQAVLNTGSATR